MRITKVKITKIKKMSAKDGVDNQRKKLGREGEEYAAEFLLRKGYQLLQKNVVLTVGEIDLLMLDEEIMVVVEVKTIAKQGDFDPILKVNRQKQRKLLSLSNILAARYPNRNIRIDAVTLYWKHSSSQPVICHYKNITG